MVTYLSKIFQKLTFLGQLRFIRVPAAFILLFLFSVVVFAGGAMYWIFKKDNEIERFRRIEIDLQSQIRERDLLLQQKKQKIEQLERRVEIFDAIEELSSAEIPEAEKWEMAKFIDTESQKYNHDPLLIVAMIYTESSFRSGVISHKGAQGLLQIMPHTGRALSKEIVNNPKLIGLDETQSVEPHNLKEIEDNIRLGILYFTQLLMKYKNVNDAFTAYNMGPSRFDQLKQSGQRISRRYATKILTKYHDLREKQTAPPMDLPKIYARDTERSLVAQINNQ